MMRKCVEVTASPIGGPITRYDKVGANRSEWPCDRQASRRGGRSASESQVEHVANLDRGRSTFEESQR